MFSRCVAPDFSMHRRHRHTIELPSGIDPSGRGSDPAVLRQSYEKRFHCRCAPMRIDLRIPGAESDSFAVPVCCDLCAIIRSHEQHFDE